MEVIDLYYRDEMGDWGADGVIIAKERDRR